MRNGRGRVFCVCLLRDGDAGVEGVVLGDGVGDADREGGGLEVKTFRWEGIIRERNGVGYGLANAYITEGVCFGAVTPGNIECDFANDLRSAVLGSNRNANDCVCFVVVDVRCHRGHVVHASDITVHQAADIQNAASETLIITRGTGVITIARQQLRDRVGFKLRLLGQKGCDGPGHEWRRRRCTGEQNGVSLRP